MFNTPTENRRITSSFQFSSPWLSVPAVLQRHKLWIGLITVLIPQWILVIPSAPIPPWVGFGNAPQRTLSSGQIWLQNQYNDILLEIFNNFCSIWSSVEQREILLKLIKSKCEIPLHISIRRVRLDLVLNQLTYVLYQITESSRPVRPTVTIHFLGHTSSAS